MIRRLAGRTHWATAVLFFLGAWLISFLVGMGYADTNPAMRRSLISAFVGAYLLYTRRNVAGGGDGDDEMQ